jgi:hypothetical protein
MRLVQAVADHTMMVRGYEHHTLECPGCHEVERRLVFAKPIEPTPIEPAPTNLTSVEPTRASRGAQPAAPSSTATPKENARARAPSSTWERALDRLRSQQSSLDERAAGAKSSETRRHLHQTWDGKTWDGFKPRRHDVPSGKATPSLAQQPAQPVSTATPSGKDGSQHAATPTGALARVAAKLRSHQASMQARPSVKEHPLDGQPLERLWESNGASARAPSGKPPASRPMPLPRSRSLVCIDTRPPQAPGTWASAVAMLQRRQGSA